MESCP
jgi:methylenetetrahydrofolate dehydrogenase (NADP+) / methenyltetrahydrofolate cyclohydrolase / formyltetrahydrofolate synthetase